MIAILGLLAVVLTPIFLGARERSRQSVCAGNLGQIYKATALYAEDNDGFRPMYGVGVDRGNVDGREVTWPDQSAELVKSLSPYTRSAALWFCPDDPLRGSTGAVKRHMATSYLCQTSRYTPPSGPPLPVQILVAGRNLARTPLLADDILSCAPGPRDTFLYTHNQRFNVVFLDGHVDTERATDANAWGDCTR